MEFGVEKGGVGIDVKAADLAGEFGAIGCIISADDIDLE